jgi:hypothetical protein
MNEHFGGRIAVRDEVTLREHIVDCASCRRHYRRHLLLSRLDPHALGWQERIGRSLGIRRIRWRWMLGIPTVACLALLFALAPHRAFVPRSGGAPMSALLVYGARPGERPTPVIGRIRPDDELAFAYRNPENWARLAVLAVDASQRVHWYHPAWNDGTQDPEAVTIAGGAELNELPDAVAQPLAEGRLSVYGVFTNHRLTVRQIEAHVSPDGTLTLPSARIVKIDLEVAQ